MVLGWLASVGLVLVVVGFGASVGSGLGSIAPVGIVGASVGKFVGGGSDEDLGSPQREGKGSLAIAIGSLTGIQGYSPNSLSGGMTCEMTLTRELLVLVLHDADADGPAEEEAIGTAAVGTDCRLPVTQA